MIHIETGTWLAFTALTAAFLALWIPSCAGLGWLNQRLWLIFLALAVAAGLFFNILQPIALFWLVLLAACIWSLEKRSLARGKQLAFFFIALLVTVGSLTHMLPGFNNPKIISALRLSEDALPYDKFFNFDSTSAALLMIAFGHRRLSSRAQWRQMLEKTAPILGLTMLAVMLLSFLLGYVHWQPKWTPVFFIWAWGNLFFTCFIEEALFRGFIQKNLTQKLHHLKHGSLIALMIAALLFGLAHSAGGGKYVLLATVAGVGYGYGYLQTKQLEAPILIHFTLNAFHFLLFTYPALSADF